MSKSKSLQEQLAYQFSRPQLLELALSHRSAGAANNERLEFLGDALLDLIISEALYKNFPDAREGELTRSRAAMVKGDTLAEIAKEINLGDYLELGSGERKSGGHRRNSILADALEAIFAAIYIDGGIESCRNTIMHLYRERFKKNGVLDESKDSKTQLQEWLQRRKKKLPVYSVVEEHGSAHDKWFKVECLVESLGKSAVASGASKRMAEMAAAAQVLDLLKQPEI